MKLLLFSSCSISFLHISHIVRIGRGKATITPSILSSSPSPPSAHQSVVVFSYLLCSFLITFPSNLPVFNNLFLFIRLHFPSPVHHFPSFTSSLFFSIFLHPPSTPFVFLLPLFPDLLPFPPHLSSCFFLFPSPSSCTLHPISSFPYPIPLTPLPLPPSQTHNKLVYKW